ncbi:MAG: KH domain-containing protein [Clostridiales bacterium]|nr:KH domain-containing protein [Clostridiales bacterium]
MAELQEILANIARELVDDPEAVSVEQTGDGDDLTLVLNVAPDDMGKVIGRHGRIARSIRLVMKAAAGINGKRVTVDIR